jgi:class 3 adenylate cyclase/tetratricopeptide (TPR) repeat protein
VCSRESPDEFGFCPGCGAALTTTERREERKVVTVLFCDLSGSTALGERTDPEALRGLMRRYYEGSRAVLERHGATVEKFVGDAVMAVFGIPSSSEEDALRAVRSAFELRSAVAALGLEARIGINTGPVVASEGDTLVTGDAVNVAARLEQAADPGEILMGEGTAALVRDAVESYRVELTVKGKSGAVVAHRLLSLDPEASGVARQLDRPLVGRHRERARLRAEFVDVAETNSCRLLTVIGPAGVGKSRLLADFLDGLGEDATVVRGRARSYGEGITYWPLVEILLQLGIPPEEAILTSPADTQLATRALLEREAAARPLVVVVDDLHWAEAPLLDLLEHLVDWSREVALLLLCVARPELLTVRPQWGGGRSNASALLLEPLPRDDATTLLESLFGQVVVTDEIRERVLAVADGNPLFLEELSALAGQAGALVDVPPTIQALLQARLDTLDGSERAVIDRGAVEGKVFHRGAVTALLPERLRDEIPARLLTLVRKELVRPESAQIPGDDAFRFRHLLIRDAAYEAMPKATRADLHERFAEWLDAQDTVVERDGLVGYHLERATRLRSELDAGDPRVHSLRARAAARLGAAGLAASATGDLHAARNLLERACALEPAAAQRRRLLPDLVEALFEAGEHDAVGEPLLELEEGDERDRAAAVALRARWEPNLDDAGYETTRGALDAAQQVFEAAGDLVGVARCEWGRAFVAWGRGRAGESFDATVRAYSLFVQAGEPTRGVSLIAWIAITAFYSGATVADARKALSAVAAGSDRAGPLVEMSVAVSIARLDFIAGSIEFSDLEELSARHSELMRQTGASAAAATQHEHFLAYSAWMEGDDELSASYARRHLTGLESINDRLFLANMLAGLAVVLCRVGLVDEAADLVERARELAHPDDVADEIMLAAADARVGALRGDRQHAFACLERARATLGTIDMPQVVDDVDHAEAEVLLALGEHDAASRIFFALAADADRRGQARRARRFRADAAARG